MINIVIYGICQEMYMNGQQNTLPDLAVATSALVLIVEGFTAHMVADPTVTRLTATTVSRILAAALMVYVHYFM